MLSHRSLLCFAFHLLPTRRDPCEAGPDAPPNKSGQVLIDSHVCQPVHELCPNKELIYLAIWLDLCPKVNTFGCWGDLVGSGLWFALLVYGMAGVFYPALLLGAST